MTDDAATLAQQATAGHCEYGVPWSEPCHQHMAEAANQRIEQAEADRDEALALLREAVAHEEEVLADDYGRYDLEGPEGTFAVHGSGWFVDARAFLEKHRG